MENRDLPEWLENNNETREAGVPLPEGFIHNTKIEALESVDPLNPENFAGRDEYYQRLQQLNTAADPFPNSDGPENPYSDIDDYEKYTDVLAEYQSSNHQTDKTDFIIQGDANVGHKLHINVAPENVQAVSNYLISEGYSHKYLKGGKIEKGKIFTIYIGSFDLAYKMASKISKDLQPYLCMPADNREVEYAANVVGRFCPGEKVKDFSHYGNTNYRGIPMTTRATCMAIAFKKPPAAKYFEEGYEILADSYGKYFHGGSDNLVGTPWIEVEKKARDETEKLLRAIFAS